jgi:LytS/YehU family sensor histidine kinase
VVEQPKRIEITITNTWNPGYLSPKGNGIALDNVRQRLAFHFAPRSSELNLQLDSKNGLATLLLLLPKGE